MCDYIITKRRTTRRHTPMATIRFKAKVRGKAEEKYIKIPAITRSNCNMQEMRAHPIIGDFANCELFFSAVRKCLAEKGITYSIMKLTDMPECMKIVDEGLSLTIEIDV